MSDTPKLTPELVSMAIENGMLDASLPALRSVLNVREEVLNKRAAGNLNPGDQFTIKDCSPKKYNGVRVEFVKHDGMWLVCRVTSQYAQHHLGSSIRLRASHVGTVFPKGA